MKITLVNNQIKAIIDTLGAELIHLTYLKTNFDYMWSGDSKYWTGHSPVLFPIIGSLTDNELIVDHKTYPMGNHGFARKSDFECVSHSDLEARFQLIQNDVTLSQYPFDFRLELIYTLIGTAISLRYEITNTGSKILPFQIGTHPAFNCPMGSTHTLSDWYLEFEKKEVLSRIAIKDNLLDLDHTTLTLDNSKLLPLTPEAFYECAMVFKSIESTNVALKSHKTPESVVVSFKNLPDLAIWQPKDAPFICIEPWYGHGDPIGFKGDIMDKMNMIHLEPTHKYEAELRIRLS